MTSSEAPAPIFALGESLHAVALKLPQFWRKRARVWFSQAESEFAIRNISADATKFHYVVSALDEDTAERVIDLLEFPPATDRYTALKKRLLETFELSRYERAGQIIHMSDLGDDRPSALMDKMLSLLGDHKTCFLFERLFLERLPEDIRGTLIHADIHEPRALAQAADKLWEAHRPSTNALRVRRDKIRTRKSPSPTLCFYHAVYGKKAHKCNAPCKFEDGEGVSENALVVRQ